MGYFTGFRKYAQTDGKSQTIITVVSYQLPKTAEDYRSLLYPYLYIYSLTDSNHRLRGSCCIPYLYIYSLTDSNHRHRSTVITATSVSYGKNGNFDPL